jgi:hypothetical protein
MAENENANVFVIVISGITAFLAVVACTHVNHMGKLGPPLAIFGEHEQLSFSSKLDNYRQ